MPDRNEPLPSAPPTTSETARAPLWRPVPPQPDQPRMLRGQPGRLVIVPDQLPSAGPGPEPAAPPRRDLAPRVDPVLLFMGGFVAGAFAMTAAVFCALQVHL